jgi:predicted nuclease with TOPRIM domain
MEQKNREKMTTVILMLIAFLCFLVEELQLKLREKDELLKSAENSRDQMNTVNAKLDEMKHQVSEKEHSLKYAQQQLSDAKVLI